MYCIYIVEVGGNVPQSCLPTAIRQGGGRRRRMTHTLSLSLAYPLEELASKGLFYQGRILDFQKHPLCIE